LKRVLAGDLDWIVMKALEKDRNRRYDSASSLAEDIQHYLHSEPVTARPPTARYRIGKFARKHRVGVTVATMLGFALILGIAGTTWGLFRALAAEETARARETSERIAKLDALDQKRKAVEARTQAETLAKRTQDVLKIVTDSFKSVNPDSGGEAEMAAKQVLFNAQDSMDASSLDDQGKADLLASLTRAFLGLGEYEAAIETAREQVSLRNSLSGSADDSTITAMSELAGALAHRGQLKKALQLYEFIHETELANFGEEAQVTLESASNLGEMYRKLGRLDESIEMQESTLEVLQRKSAESGRHSENEVMILNNLATAYKNKGRIDEALLMYEQARLAMESFFGEDHPQTLNTIQNLATAYQEAGRIDEALELFEEVRDRMEVKLGPNHPLTLAATTSLSSAYIAKGRFEDAVPLLEQTVEQMKRSVGEDNEPTIIASMNLAYANRMAGHLQEAIDSLQRLSDIATDKFGADHPNTLLLTLHLADACLEANDVEQARDLFESGSETANRKLGARHPVSRALAEGLAKSLQESKQPADAIKLLQQHVEIAKSMEGAAHPRTLFLMRRLAEAYREQGEYDALIPLLEALVENNRKAHGEDHPNTSTYMHNLGVSLLELKRFEQAAEIFQELYDLEVRKSGEGDPSTILPQAGLGACYVRLGRVDEGLAKLNEAWAASDEGREKDWIHDQLVSAYKSLEETALNDGDDDAAGKWRSEMKKIDENTPAQASPLADDSGGR
jgi:tetratricopeptide (TPR) repeat protein